MTPEQREQELIKQIQQSENKVELIAKLLDKEAEKWQAGGKRSAVTRKDLHSSGTRFKTASIGDRDRGITISASNSASMGLTGGTTVSNLFQESHTTLDSFAFEEPCSGIVNTCAVAQEGGFLYTKEEDKPKGRFDHLLIEVDIPSLESLMI